MISSTRYLLNHCYSHGIFRHEVNSSSAGLRRFLSASYAAGVAASAMIGSQNNTSSDNNLDPTQPSSKTASFPYPSLRASAMVLPHPDKAHKGGEDAYCVTACGRVAAVADGVGGWVSHGVDPAIYSQGLMKALHKHVSELGHTCPLSCLRAAWNDMKGTLGSSTALVVSLQDDYALRVCNVGDSAFMVVRDGKVLFRSQEQTHGFNFPFQLGYGGDDVSTAQQYAVKLQPGDTLVLGTDGLWDNLFDEEVLKIVKASPSDNQETARQLAHAASCVGHDEQALSPFAKSSGGRFMGGKLDDITVIVATVQSPQIEAKL